MKVLVTGNKGFIATYLQAQFPTDWEVHGFEIRDDPRDWKGRYDVIFHTAALARTAECTDDPFGQAHRSNVELTRILLDEFEFKQIIYTSSCAIYGSVDGTISELTRPAPPSVYAAQKLLSEEYIHFNGQHKGYHSTCLRLFNTYGPLQSKLGAYPNVIAAMVRSFKEAGHVEVTGDGTQTRDFVFVTDVAEAIMSVVGLPGQNIFNVSTGKRTPILDVASFFEKTVFVPDRPFDLKHQVASPNKIFDATGWKAKTSFAEGMDRTLRHEGLR